VPTNTASTPRSRLEAGEPARGALWRVLRGNVVARLIARAPTRTRIVIVG
jgi:hypothetical protein